MAIKWLIASLGVVFIFEVIFIFGVVLIFVVIFVFVVILILSLSWSLVELGNNEMTMFSFDPIMNKTGVTYLSF